MCIHWSAGCTLQYRYLPLMFWFDQSNGHSGEGHQQEAQICCLPPEEIQPEQDQPQSPRPPAQTHPEVPSIHPLSAGEISPPPPLPSSLFTENLAEACTVQSEC